MTLGGFLCARNLISLDYSFVEAIKSMLPICDQIVVSESASTDGTRQYLDGWARREPKLNIVDFAWPDPKGDPSFYPRWLNDARSHLETDYACTLDMDECFHEKDYDLILDAVKQQKVLMCYRYNFWSDAQHLIPVGVCCGVDVIRVGPRRMAFPSDYPTPESAEISALAVKSPVGVYHYGFLRERSAFFRKAKTVQKIWANDYDPRLEAADKAGGNWMQNPEVAPWVNELTLFTGSHPKSIHTWILDRGYKLD